MEPNQNPPSEREWTIEEREDFFKSQDALTCNFNDVPKQPPIEWSTGAWGGPLIELDPNDPFGHMEMLFSSGIHVTSVTPPAQGWLVGCHCPICKVTTLFLSPYAAKPTVDGKEFDGYHIVKDMCMDQVEGFRHNMRLGMKGYEAPIDLKPGGFLL